MRPESQSHERTAARLDRCVEHLQPLAALIKEMLHAARIPGAAVAVVVGDTTVFARGFGYRDLEAKLPLDADTVYPIASTTKSINATLLGMLVDDGLLEWDAPVQRYLPRFWLHDPLVGPSVTLRDLVTMCTGLPRHDFLWMESGVSRAELVERVAHLPLSAGLRARFQYTNLTPTLAGHVAEVVGGQRWEALVRERILNPLAMNATGFELPRHANTTLSYHENARRELLPTQRLRTDPIGPAGGSMHSTANDMTRWLAFNLSRGRAAGRQLIQPRTLQDIHTPWVVMGSDPAAPSRGAAYGLGWFVDSYNGHRRISHTGHLHDVNGCVTLFPDESIGLVSYTNFASARLASLINQQAFDLLLGLRSLESIDEVLTRYERKILETHARNEATRRVVDTRPSHDLAEYAGIYCHSGYGRVDIRLCGETLRLERNELVLPLEHWHYDAWVVAENDLFEIHKQHAFERANRIQFQTSADGDIAAFTMRLEPAVNPVRFEKQRPIST